jgi:serine/threonine protein kinase
MPPEEKWWIVLADFGISKRADESNAPTTKIGGTDGYKAPELLGFPGFQKPKHVSDFKAADLWALGEIVFRMLTTEATFESEWKLFEHCQRKQQFPSDRLPTSVGDDCKEFVTGVMEADPHNRMTTAQCLKHRWIEPLSVEETLTVLSLESTSHTDPRGSDNPQNEPPSATWSSLSDLESGSHRKTDMLSRRQQPSGQRERLKLQDHPSVEGTDGAGHTPAADPINLVSATRPCVLTVALNSTSSPGLDNDELEDLLSDEGLSHEVSVGLIRNVRIPSPSSQPPPSDKQVLFPAHLINLVTSEMWNNGFVRESEKFLANVMQSIQRTVMGTDYEKAVNVGAFWLCNAHQLLSFVILAEEYYHQKKIENFEYSRLLEIVKYDMESLEFNIYHIWMIALKKKMHKMIIPAIIETQSSPGGNGFFSNLLASSPATSTDNLLSLFNDIYKAMKAYGLEHSIITQTFTELLKLINATAFNDLIMRRNFPSWKRGFQINHNVTKIEEWCKNHDMPDCTRHLEHLIQATKLLRLKKSTQDDIEVIHDICWLLSPVQVERLLSQYAYEDHEVPINSKVMKHLSSLVTKSDVPLFIAIQRDDCGPYEVAEPRVITALETHAPSCKHIRWHQRQGLTISSGLETPKLKRIVEILSAVSVD